MADKLTIYNNALLLIGERPLSSLTENAETRYRLDTVYDQNAPETCLEMVKPQFSIKTVSLASSGTTAEHGLEYRFTLPSDYVGIHTVFANANLDDILHRYLIESRELFADVSTVYLRYVSNARALTDWTPMFAQVVSAYLAQQIAPRFAPQKIEVLSQQLSALVESAVKIEGAKTLDLRPATATVTLDDTWRRIYNDALLMLGLPQIISNTDDSDRRAKLDVARDTGVVATVLEDVGWSFALTSDKISADPSLNPAWGYQYVFRKPTDLHRIHGIFHDEHMRNPIRRYVDEGDYWYCGQNEIYVQYVQKGVIDNPSNWPQYFTNCVAAELAVRAGPSISGALLENARAQQASRVREAKSTDAMISPPQIIADGQWTQSRRGDRRSRFDGRP